MYRAKQRGRNKVVAYAVEEEASTDLSPAEVPKWEPARHNGTL